jgi:hypothetical protein
VVGALDALRHELDGAHDAATARGLSRDQPLTRTEVWQLADYAGVWFLGTVCGAVVMTAVGLGNLRETLAASLRWGLASGPIIVCLASGSLLHAGEMLVVRRGMEADHGPLVVGSSLSRWAGMVIGGALIALYVVLAYTSSPSWLTNALAGLFLVAAGYVLMPLLGVLSLWFAKWWARLRGAVALALLFLSRVVQGLVIMLETVARFFAEPLDRLIGPRRGAPAESVALDKWALSPAPDKEE